MFHILISSERYMAIVIDLDNINWNIYYISHRYFFYRSKKTSWINLMFTTSVSLLAVDHKCNKFKNTFWVKKKIFQFSHA